MNENVDPSENRIISSLSAFDTHLLTQSNDIKDAEKHILEWASPHKLKILGNAADLNISFSAIDLADIHLIRARYGASIYGEPVDYRYYYTHTLLRGSSIVEYKGLSEACVKGHSVVLSPSIPYTIRLDDLCDRVVMRIEPAKIKSYLAKVLNYEINTEVEFVCKAGNFQGLSNMIEFILRQISAEPKILQHKAIKDAYSQMIVANLVMLHEHNLSFKIHQKPEIMPHPQIKTAMDYIQGNCDKNISAADVASFCNVTVRTLQRNFIKYLNTTPSKYIRNIKLEKVHEKLLQSAYDKNISVKQALLDLGVIDFGRFANYYRKKYGCTPNETIKKQKNVGFFSG